MKNYSDISKAINLEQLPTFLGIGSQRCASTWLDKVLQEHPDIVLAPKEYQFWSNKIRTESLDSYCKLFRELQKDGITLVRGEIDPSYAVMRREEIAIVKQIIPDLKIILIIRNPVERLISQITRGWTYYYVDKGASTSRNIFKLLRSVDNGLSHRFTDYTQIYQNWSYFFGEGNIHIELYDSLKADSREVIKETLSFLEVDQEFSFPEDVFMKKPNSSKINEEEIPHLLKWYLSKKWLPKVHTLQEELDLDLSFWIESMEKTAAEGEFYYYLIVLIHKLYFLIPYTLTYKIYNVIRIPLKIRQIRKNLNSQLSIN